MKLYLAGPMRGIYEFNFPAFFDAAAELRALGHTVFSPAERDVEEYGDSIWRGRSGNPAEVPFFDYRKAYYADITHICQGGCEAVVCLPGWEASRGATGEVAIARALELRVYELDYLI
jgi:Domain of unknown function (DUF4406)